MWLYNDVYYLFWYFFSVDSLSTRRLYPIYTLVPVATFVKSWYFREVIFRYTYELLNAAEKTTKKRRKHDFVTLELYYFFFDLCRFHGYHGNNNKKTRRKYTTSLRVVFPCIQIYLLNPYTTFPNFHQQTMVRNMYAFFHSEFDEYLCCLYAQSLTYRVVNVVPPPSYYTY